MKFTLRIKDSRVFKYILRKGKYRKNKNICVHITKNKGHFNYFGVCVSKKNGNSVNRNKLKRWAREVYKVNENSLKRGYNIVIIYMKNATVCDLNYNMLKEEIYSCFKELNLYEKYY